MSLETPPAGRCGRAAARARACSARGSECDEPLPRFARQWHVASQGDLVTESMQTDDKVARFGRQSSRVPEQQERHGLEQARRRHGLVEERLVRSQGMPFGEQPVRKAGEIEHLQIGEVFAETACELVPVHGRHREIGQQEIERRLAGQQLEGFGGAECERRFVPAAAQHAIREPDDRLLVIHDQYPIRSSRGRHVVSAT